uniref:Uncharacterized protein n=1 Tax=Mesocestoides corti TaxID=53468 RepID=A0A5K3FG88_MESCO
MLSSSDAVEINEKGAQNGDTFQNRKTSRLRRYLPMLWRPAATVLVPLIIVIVLQMVIICLIVNSHQAQKSSDQMCAPGQAGNKQSELVVRGQMLQLADLLSWDAKCNRVLHDLVVSCYGAPDYLANKDKERVRPFQFHRNFPQNLQAPSRQLSKKRKQRPPKPGDLGFSGNQSHKDGNTVAAAPSSPSQPDRET